MRKLIHLSWALLGVVSLSGGCSSNHVVVEAKSPAIDTYQGSVGNLNTPRYAVGDVVAMDAATHKVWKAASVQVDPLDMGISPPLRETSEPVKGELHLWYSQKVPSGVKAEVADRVESETVLHVEDYFTHGLKNPAEFVAGSTQLSDALAKVHQQSPDAKFFLVSAVTSAKKVYLSCDDADKKLAHMGKRDFEVKYGQNQKLADLAQKDPAFFKLTPLKLEAGSVFPAVAVDKDFGSKLPDHDFGQVLAAMTLEE